MPDDSFACVRFWLAVLQGQSYFRRGAMVQFGLDLLMIIFIGDEACV